MHSTKKLCVFLTAAALLFASCEKATDPKSNDDDTTFTLNVTNVGNGTVTWTPEGSSFEAGTEITVTGSGNEGYALEGWKNGSGTTISTNNPYTFEIQANTTLVGSFMPVTA